VARPGAPHHFLLPGLVDAQVRRVNQAAQNQVREILAEIIKIHPGKIMDGSRMKNNVNQYRFKRTFSLRVDSTRCTSHTYNSALDRYLQ